MNTPTVPTRHAQGAPGPGAGAISRKFGAPSKSSSSTRSAAPKRSCITQRRGRTGREARDAPGRPPARAPAPAHWAATAGADTQPVPRPDRAAAPPSRPARTAAMAR